MPYPDCPSFLKEQIKSKVILLFLLFLLLISFSANAQRPVYKILATLNTSNHTLSGTINITYTNQSDQTLEQLGIHLWPNAYRHTNTSLVDQQLHHGNIKLFRASEQDLGSIDSLDFTSPDQSVSLIADPTDIDIAWIKLSTPLSPGSTIHLSSPYKLVIPKSFSRLGRTGNAYQLTQWYPHIAVFDENGWNTMPYLDQGEFFNDFADYEVTISTPARYMVAATGSLISENENSKLTTRVYKAANVIDFAWFAGDKFVHTTKLVDAGREDSVELNVFIEQVLDKDWHRAMEYAERAIKFYSDWLGPYPYPQMTVVYTPFSKAGYMEYPMLAQISYVDDPQLLDRVIAHEIGHTWLYGILANNERKDPWLDEGFNSFLENEYMHAYYDKPSDMAFPEVVDHRSSMDHYEAWQHMVRSAGDLQPPLTSPERQKNSQYVFSAYMLPSQGLQLMKQQLGSEMMKKMFRNYFSEHKFTHVDRADAKSSFEKACGCNLAWFFDEWLHHSHDIDYRIKNLDFSNNKITIENKATSKLPLTLSEYTNDKIIKQQWLPGFENQSTISILDPTDEVRLYEGVMGVNKQWWNNIRPRSFRPVINIFPKIGNYQRPSWAITPVIGYNLTDGGLPGIAITSDLIPQPRLKIFALPMYGIESKTFRFYGEARYITDLKSDIFDKILLGFSGSSFGYNVDTHYLFRDHFERLSPSLGIRLKNKDPYSHVTRWLKYRYVDITQHYGKGIHYENHIYTDEKRNYGVHELAFKISSDTVIQPYTATAGIQTGKGFIRLNLNYNQHFAGKDKMKGLWVHGYVGWMPVHTNPTANVIFTFNGLTSNGFFSKDYMYDEWMLGRNANDGDFSRQIFIKDAGLKTLSTVGFSDDWMAGGGVSTALPLKFLHVYMDAAFYNSSITEKLTLSYSGGLSVILIKDAFEIYIPILESKDIRQSLSYQVRDQWFDRISFLANFKFANPLYLVDHYQYNY